MVVVRRVALTLIAACAAGRHTRLDRSADDFDIRLRLAAHDPACRIALVRTVLIEPNAAHQLGHVRLAETGVGAGVARRGAVKALVYAPQQQLAVEAARPRMPFDDFLNRHVVLRSVRSY